MWPSSRCATSFRRTSRRQEYDPGHHIRPGTRQPSPPRVNLLKRPVRRLQWCAACTPASSKYGDTDAPGLLSRRLRGAAEIHRLPTIRYCIATWAQREGRFGSIPAADSRLTDLSWRFGFPSESRPFPLLHRSSARPHQRGPAISAPPYATKSATNCRGRAAQTSLGRS